MRAPLPVGWRLRRWLAALVLLAAALATAGLILAGLGWPFGGQPPAGAPLEPAPPASVSPFLNTRPAVQYVGDAACAGCHRGLSRSYHAHPMGRSFAPVTPGDGLEPYPATFEALHMRFTAERRGDRVFHKVVYLDAAGKPAPGVEAEAEVQYAVGSGTQGRSYLLNRDGYLYQSPISWYTLKKSWDLSPGYRTVALHFTRGVSDRCLFCHCNDARPVEGTENGYRTDPLFRSHAIGCERCHGPGELHVALRKRGDDPGEVDHSIVNPRHLEPALREAVCQQCHLQGAEAVVRRGRSLRDYRPGLPLHDFLSVYVKPPELADNYKVVSHVEQMHVSRCFVKSGGKLGCTSCHDPHALPKPEWRVEEYRGACLKCHGEAACTLPVAERRAKDPQDSCIECHMPRAPTSDVAHAAITDHRIVRSPGKPPRPRSGLAPGSVPLLFFHRDLVRGPDPGRERDLALAMVRVSQKPGDERVRRLICQRALPLLRAGGKAPEDVPAWEAEGYALWQVGRPEEALATLEAMLQRQPRRVSALRFAAEVAEESGRLDAAQGYARRVVEVNPWDAQGWECLARVQVARGEWGEVGATCREALKRDPANVSVRCLLVRYHMHRGDRDAARAEFERILALNPPRPEELRRWFDGLQRSGSP
jgi:predicted CXXCH cytochrome family protein